MYREFSWGKSLGNIHLTAGRKQKENITIHFGDTECEGRSWLSLRIALDTGLLTWNETLCLYFLRVPFFFLLPNKFNPTQMK